jgi:feruloyl esterase
LLLNPDPTAPVADFIGLLTAWVVNWMHEDPDYDWRKINLSNYGAEFAFSERKFSGIAATDSTRLNAIRNRGGKIIHYHGIADPLILPFGSYNYVSRLFDRYGVAGTQGFMRSFFYPGNGHCGGGTPGTPLINRANLFDTLVDWVENDNPPDFVVATNLAGSRSAKICKYPDETVYDGLGDPMDHNSYHCAIKESEPADLAADSDLDGALNRRHHRFP